ncbi:MAG: hypothetical protein A3F93_01270 [Candidatus Magasanikbacteria bacterium RIFCSPLOWO2_12_FULL_34_7]|nr:MAG: hypothetical protein A3F93_01270 [Candidatus Magasanikbacteria bacterium RIFCSPLOWO2_12_FULL_34_7]
MKENTSIDINTLRILYEKYKKHLIYFLIIFISFLLFLFAVLPRIQDLVKLNKDRKIESNKLSILKSNLSLLSALDDSSLNSQLQIVSSALPSENNFEGVLNAISSSAEKSGVLLSDYEFQVGDLSKKEVKTTGFPFLTLVVNIKGTSSQVVKFIGNLSKSAPLSEITSITQGRNSASTTVVFYYKSLPPFQFKDSESIAPVSKKGREIIETLSSWGIGRLSQSPVVIPTASSSSSPFWIYL